MQLAFHLQQFFAFALHHLGHRNAGGAAHHLGNFFCPHLGAQQAVACASGFAGFFGLGFFEEFFQLRQLAILKFGHLVEIALAGVRLNLLAQLIDLLAHMLAALGLRFFRAPDFLQIGGFFFQLDDFFFDQFESLARGFILFFFDRFALNLQLNQAPIELVDDFGFGVDLDLDFGGCLVNQVDGFVRQKAVGNVAVAQLGRGHNGRVGNVHTMVDFVFFLQTAQDGNRRFHGRLAHQNFLKTPLQRSVFFDVFAVFV